MNLIYILDQIIDKIYVYEQGDVDVEIKQKVEIHYKLIVKLE